MDQHVRVQRLHFKFKDIVFLDPFPNRQKKFADIQLLLQAFIVCFFERMFNSNTFWLDSLLATWFFLRNRKQSKLGKYLPHASYLRMCLDLTEWCFMAKRNLKLAWKGCQKTWFFNAVQFFLLWTNPLVPYKVPLCSLCSVTFFMTQFRCDWSQDIQ